MNEVTVKSAEDLVEIVEKALADVSILEDMKLLIDPDLIKLTLHLEGDYNATITPAMMRSLLSIQDAIYEVYSYKLYGYKKRLSAEERESVDFVATVQAGSTSIDILLQKAMEAMSRMTGTQALTAIGILATAYLVGTLGKHAFDYFAKLNELKQRAAESSGYQQLIATTVASALEGQKDFLRTLAKEPFRSLEINGDPVTREEIKEMTKTPRQLREEADEVYRGEFKITRIYIEDDGTFIDATHISSNTPISYINILKDYISQGDYQWIKDAVRDGTGQPIHMTVVAHTRGGEIQSSILQSIGDGSRGKQ
jgi:hypothetical protein